jgi:hypothetical protein
MSGSFPRLCNPPATLLAAGLGLFRDVLGGHEHQRSFSGPELPVLRRLLLVGHDRLQGDQNLTWRRGPFDQKKRIAEPVNGFVPIAAGEPKYVGYIISGNPLVAEPASPPQPARPRSCHPSIGGLLQSRP